MDEAILYWLKMFKETRQAPKVVAYASGEFAVAFMLTAIVCDAIKVSKGKTGTVIAEFENMPKK